MHISNRVTLTTEILKEYIYLTCNYGEMFPPSVPHVYNKYNKDDKHRFRKKEIAVKN